MTGSNARTRDLLELAAIWHRRGLTVTAMTGWEDRGREAGNTFEVLGCHHTAAAVDVDRILRDGRPDVPGPLCNVALHRDGEVILVASGRANHFGVATWPSSRALGVEATGPPFQNYDAYVQLAAGFCEWKGAAAPTRVLRHDTTIPVYLVAGHKEVAQPYGRKPNPAGEGFNNGGRTIAGVQLIDDFRTDVARALLEEDDLNDTDRIWLEGRLDAHTKEVTDLVRKLIGKAPANGLQGTLGILAHGDPGPEDTRNSLDSLADQLDELKELVSPPEPPA